MPSTALVLIGTIRNAGELALSAPGNDTAPNSLVFAVRFSHTG